MKKFISENRALLIRLSVSAVLILLALIINTFNEQVAFILYLCAYMANAYKIIYQAVKKLILKGEVGEKMLMTIATLGAIVTDAYLEAALIVVLYFVGELIEGGVEFYSKKSITALCELRPSRARLKTGELVSVDAVLPGQLIEVYAGERIPLDGEIIEGVADIDTSLVTGESTPINVRAGAQIYSGYLDLNGALTVLVTKKNSESMVQRIIDVSLEAGSKKSNSEVFIKKFAKIYTPSVIALAFLVAFIPSVSGFDAFDWLYKAFALLAISCPCAILISVPLAYLFAIGHASRKGLLIKGSKTVESLATLNTMVFDKTGTLTNRDLRVSKVESFGDYTKMELLEIVAIAELKSNHPMAMAVLKEAERFKISISAGENYKEEIGFGVECDSKFGKIKAGSHKYVGGCRYNSQATIYVSLDGKYIGYIGVGDNIKPNGKKAFNRLRENGIQKIYILSGDKKSKVDMVASTLYADGAYSQLLPGEKLDALEDIIINGKDVKVGYCGDGINDLPCISRADVGIAIGTISTDAAQEHSDLIIIDDDLEKIPRAIAISKNARRRVIGNIAFAISAKVIIAVLSIAITNFPMALAVLADVGVMLITVINSLFAGRGKK